VKHAEFEEKEARRARLQLRLAKAGKEGRIKARVVANPEYVVFPPRLMAHPAHLANI
jgi:hypothetical protein